MSASKPTLYVTNNSSVPLPVTLFLQDQPPGDADQNGAAWNVCSQLYTSLTTVQIQAKRAADPGFTTYTATITQQSLAGVIAALNSLNIGGFQGQVINGTQYITAFSNDFTYGQLDINDNAVANVVQFEWEFIGADDQPNLLLELDDDDTATTLFSVTGPPGPGVTSGSGTSAPNPVTKGANCHFEATWTLARNVVGQLYVNGCLVQTQQFDLVHSVPGIFVFDRNEDQYRFVITLSI